jgi:hypothetical protein
MRSARSAECGCRPALKSIISANRECRPAVHAVICRQERLKALLEERKKLVECGAEAGGHSHARSASNGEGQRGGADYCVQL